MKFQTKINTFLILLYLPIVIRRCIVYIIVKRMKVIQRQHTVLCSRKGKLCILSLPPATLEMYRFLLSKMFGLPDLCGRKGQFFFAHSSVRIFPYVFQNYTLPLPPRHSSGHVLYFITKEFPMPRDSYHCIDKHLQFHKSRTSRQISSLNHYCHNRSVVAIRAPNFSERFSYNDTICHSI